jgi:hypothetical protein
VGKNGEIKASAVKNAESQEQDPPLIETRRVDMKAQTAS